MSSKTFVFQVQHEHLDEFSQSDVRMALNITSHALKINGFKDRQEIITYPMPY